MPISTKETQRYLYGLNEEGLRQICVQLLMQPESRVFIEKCIEEFNKAYFLPIKK